MNAEDFRLRAEFRLQDEFRLQRAPNRMSSSQLLSSGPIFVFKFRLRAQFELQLLANNFVFESFGISASGENETGTQFPGSMYICHHPLRYLGFRLYADALLKWADGKGIGKHESALFESTRSCLHLRVKPTISVIGSRKINVGKTNNSNNFHEYREIS